MVVDSLTDRDLAILAMERQFWKTPGGKETAIREVLGMTPIRFYQRLNQIIASPAALAHDPVTVNRLRRIAVGRRLQRR